ncbi:uncharacterized protein LOC100501927 [Zea mays]|uniref:Uncharacterized protein n=1 Tax=Zea mays TaxID=4577 RepID=C4J704_MAIZE|nr:uncharacterized protein LOC100501927 [Zea mays]ACR36954.1 unknown [Zea mays]|eukprot:NP_001183494.1 uncharacterized protein LOC100501927 [Zea mays]
MAAGAPAPEISYHLCSRDPSAHGRLLPIYADASMAAVAPAPDISSHLCSRARKSRLPTTPFHPWRLDILRSAPSPQHLSSHPLPQRSRPLGLAAAFPNSVCSRAPGAVLGRVPRLRGAQQQGAPLLALARPQHLQGPPVRRRRRGGQLRVRDPQRDAGVHPLLRERHGGSRCRRIPPSAASATAWPCRQPDSCAPSSSTCARTTRPFVACSWPTTPWSAGPWSAGANLSSTPPTASSSVASYRAPACPCPCANAASCRAPPTSATMAAASASTARSSSTSPGPTHRSSP